MGSVSGSNPLKMYYKFDNIKIEAVVNKKPSSALRILEGINGLSIDRINQPLIGAAVKDIVDGFNKKLNAIGFFGRACLWIKSWVAESTLAKITRVSGNIQAKLKNFEDAAKLPAPKAQTAIEAVALSASTTGSDGSSAPAQVSTEVIPSSRTPNRKERRKGLQRNTTSAPPSPAASSPSPSGPAPSPSSSNQ